MANRMKRRLQRKQKKRVMDINITSLLDILVILLVFLIQSYSASGELLQVVENLVLPTSKSFTNYTIGVIIQINKEKMWVDEEELEDFSGPSNYKSRDGLIVSLYNTLVQKRREIESLEKSTNKATEFGGIVNIVMDQTFRYSFLKKVLNTCAEAGFQEYKFIVTGEGEEG